MGLPDRDPRVLAARLTGSAPPLTQHVLDLAVLDAPAENRGLLDQACDAEERERVRLAVARLSDPYRETVTMRFFGELSILEIAAAVGRPEGTIEAQLIAGSSAFGTCSKGPRRDGLHAPATRSPIGSSPHPTPPRAGRTGRGPRHRVPAPPEDDLAILALQRYVDATDLRPSDGLAMRVRCASPQSQPRVHRAACAAPSGCSACDPHPANSLDTSVRIEAAPDVRPGALQGARYGPGDRPGGRWRCGRGARGRADPGLRRHGRKSQAP